VSVPKSAFKDSKKNSDNKEASKTSSHNNNSYNYKDHPYNTIHEAANQNTIGSSSSHTAQTEEDSWAFDDQNESIDGEMQVVNFPLAIGSHEAGRHYHRNALLFNVGFILSNKHVPSQLFSASLRRLALTLRSMEIESAFLSTPKTKVLS
jgi:hypothetical protein